MLSPEMRLLAASSYSGVQRQIGYDSRLVEVDGLDIDWTEFLRLCLRHRVENHVLVGLGDSQYPPAVKQALGNSIRNAAIVGLTQVAELARLRQAFAEAGIAILPLKGVGLSQYLFNSHSFRASSDIDVLVSAENLFAAQNLMLALGYELKNYSRPFPKRQIKHLVDAAAIHLNFRYPESNLAIELHWRLFVSRQYLALSEQRAMVERSLYRSGDNNQAAPGMADGDLLAYLILHGANHAWASLRWLLDIAVFVLRDDIDWDAWRLFVINQEIQRPVVQAFSLLDQLFGMHLPAPILDLISAEPAADKLVAHVYSTWNRPDEYHLQHGIQTRLQLKDSWRFRFDELSRAWRNPLRYPFWDLSDRFFPLNKFLSIFIQMRRVVSKEE